MVEFRTRLKNGAKLLRRVSGLSSASTGDEDGGGGDGEEPKKKSSPSLSANSSTSNLRAGPLNVVEQGEGPSTSKANSASALSGSVNVNDLQPTYGVPSSINPTTASYREEHPASPSSKRAPREADWETVPSPKKEPHDIHELTTTSHIVPSLAPPVSKPTFPPLPTHFQRPADGSRKQSLIPASQTALINTLLESEGDRSSFDSSRTIKPKTPTAITANMVTRKIWVKRAGASATLVTIHEDDLVDDVRDMILRKYANSLGRCFDAPDVTLRVVPREHANRHLHEGERCLKPDEHIARTIDAYFPGGQSVDEALVIEVPQRRTPRASPRSVNPHYYEGLQPGDYFPVMPTTISPSLPPTSAAAMAQPHAMSILNTGKAPSLPSPGGRPPRHNSMRPKAGRTHTSSPTLISTPQGIINDSSTAPPAPPPPDPPLGSTDSSAPRRTATPPPSTHLSLITTTAPKAGPSKKKPPKTSPPTLRPTLLDGTVTVPPINVLIVEDNIINLKLLEAFMKRLKVRWQTAMNGREAVTKWRAGGFHLVLMDIQLPVMNGLEATREVRRLERVNRIGVFSGTASSSKEGGKAGGKSSGAAVDEAEERDVGVQGDLEEKDRLENTVLFKSPVIIVALTASSLQSDRHEALAAGCNDFLTKPVNFVWLERKVMEWGCMQALIDFDGWRKWKDFSQKGGSSASANAAAAASSSSSAAGAAGTKATLGVGVLGKGQRKKSLLDGVKEEGTGGQGVGVGA